MKRLILFLAFGIVFFSLVGGVYAECNGMTDINIHKIERTPEEPFFKVYAIANGNGDCLKIAWTKDDLNTQLQKSSPDEITDKDITGEIQLISQTATWNTADSYVPIYNYQVETLGVFDSIGSCSDKCLEKEHPISLPEGYAGRNIISCYCVYQSGKEGEIGTLGSSRTLNDQVRFSFTNLPDKVLNTAENSGTIGDKIDVAYVGSLIGNQILERPSSDLSPFKKGGQVILVSSSKSILDSFVTDLIIDINKSGSSSESQDAINRYNSKISTLQIDKTSQWVSENPNIVKDAYFNGENFIAEVKPYQTQWPQFTLTFNASWAGVHWVTGQPEITCPSDDSFSSGASKSLKFNVKNIADEKGAFGLSLDCGGISSTLNKNKVSLDSGISEEIMATLTTSTEEAKEISCNLKAYATREPSKSDECSFNVEVIPLTSVSADELNNSEISGRTSSSTSKGSSSIGLIILIIFLILIGGSIGFFIYVKNKKVKSKSPTKSQEVTHKAECKKCGHSLKSNSKFCIKCGEKK